MMIWLKCNLPPRRERRRRAPDEEAEEIAKLRGEFQSRLVVANLRTEAVRAGMVDLDGLKLIDLSAVRLGNDDKVIGGRKLMDDLRRNKPWLFGVTSSSSAAVAPGITTGSAENGVGNDRRRICRSSGGCYQISILIVRQTRRRSQISDRTIDGYSKFPCFTSADHSARLS